MVQDNEVRKLNLVFILNYSTLYKAFNEVSLTCSISRCTSLSRPTINFRQYRYEFFNLLSLILGKVPLYESRSKQNSETYVNTLV